MENEKNWQYIYIYIYIHIKTFFNWIVNQYPKDIR